MRVLMKTLACGPNGNLDAGREYDLPDEFASALVAGGYAISIDKKIASVVAPLPVQAEVQIETPERQTRASRRERSVIK